jgi:OOP family OmpA-OmpF porin
MKQKRDINKIGKSVNFKFILKLMLFGMISTGLMATQAAAFEIITAEDVVQKTVTKEDFIKTADNVIVLMDTSQSMNHRWQKDATKSKLEAAKEILTSGTRNLPDLGYNAALYEFSPFEALYPMGPLDKEKFVQAINSIKADAEGATFLPRALRNLEPVLQGASGKTVVFIFNDGTYSEMAGLKDPGDIATELAEKYNVCFYVIGENNSSMRAQKRLQDMAKANECSRLIPTAKYINNPQYNSGALYVVKTTSEVVTVSDMKAVGAKGVNILFDFDSDAILPEYQGGLDDIGEFMQNNPNSYVVFAGFADSVGDEEYNLGLSRRRAESAGAYLQKNANIDADRIVVEWFGKLNPVADNSTPEGRRLNRRVESAVGFNE